MNCCHEKDHHASQEDSCCKKDKKEGFFAKMFSSKKCCKEHTQEKEMNGQCCRNKDQKTGTRHDVVHAGQIMLGLMEKQISGFSNEDLVVQHGGVKNHPLWTMGHIASSLDGAITLLGGEASLSENWNKKFGGGSQPVADAKAYPTADELRQTVMNLHARASQLYLDASSAHLRSPNPLKRFADMIPTTGGMVVFLMTAHLSEHIGQISAWRRAKGLPPLF